MSRKSLIPSRFKLSGIVYDVEISDDLNTNIGCAGQTDYLYSKITIQNYPSKQYRESIFFHELAHAILNNMGEHELNKNEKFIDLLGNSIHQYLKTWE